MELQFSYAPDLDDATATSTVVLRLILFTRPLLQRGYYYYYYYCLHYRYHDNNTTTAATAATSTTTSNTTVVLGALETISPATTCIASWCCWFGWSHQRRFLYLVARL